jgi:MFS family permease
VLQNLVQGITFVVHDRLMGGLIALTFFNSVFGMSYVALLPVFAGDYLRAGSGGYGVLQAASGVGAVVGTLTLAIFTSRAGRGRVLLVGAIGFGLGLMAFSQTTSMLFAIVMLGAAGYGNAFYNTLVMIILQEKVPNELRGRVLGIWGLAWNLIPLGGILAGALAAAVDARFAVLVGGTLVAGMAALMLGFGKTVRAT